MTSNLKCPFCGEELDEDTLGDFSCINSECKESICFSGSKLLWQAFIQTKEELKDCQHNYSVKSEQHERGYAYATKTIKDLESKLEIARKALKDARIFADTHCIATAVKTIDKALEQIEHKE